MLFVELRLEIFFEYLKHILSLFLSQNKLEIELAFLNLIIPTIKCTNDLTFTFI